ncbi:hypothetical protein ACFLRO_00490 [Bacteroidota bacterium]
MSGSGILEQAAVAPAVGQIPSRRDRFWKRFGILMLLIDVVLVFVLLDLYVAMYDIIDQLDEVIERLEIE